MKAVETHDSVEGLGADLWHKESLQDCIRRGILMANFTAAIRGDKVYVTFGKGAAAEAHMYPAPDDAAVERIVTAFTPPAVQDDRTEIVLDPAVYDG